MKKHVVCYGDSNTHGYDGDTGLRFDENTRWTCLLQKYLGDEYQVIEEDVGSDGIVIWFIESYVVTDSNGSLWLEEIESNKNCILNNNITRIIPLVTLKERND